MVYRSLTVILLSALLTSSSGCTLDLDRDGDPVIGGVDAGPAAWPDAGSDCWGDWCADAGVPVDAGPCWGAWCDDAGTRPDAGGDPGPDAGVPPACDAGHPDGDDAGLPPDRDGGIDPWLDAGGGWPVPEDAGSGSDVPDAGEVRDAGRPDAS